MLQDEWDPEVPQDPGGAAGGWECSRTPEMLRDGWDRGGAAEPQAAPCGGSRRRGAQGRRSGTRRGRPPRRRASGGGRRRGAPGRDGSPAGRRDLPVPLPAPRAGRAPRAPAERPRGAVGGARRRRPQQEFARPRAAPAKSRDAGIPAGARVTFNLLLRLWDASNRGNRQLQPLNRPV